MSTKSTILLSAAGEHWYHDCSDNSFVLEIKAEHLCAEEPCEGLTEYRIAEGTPLWAAMRDRLFERGGFPKSWKGGSGGRSKPLNAGDVVQLKSGGPKMTVCSTDKSDGIECRWMVDGGKARAYFPAACLLRRD